MQPGIGEEGLAKKGFEERIGNSPGEQRLSRKMVRNI